MILSKISPILKVIPNINTISVSQLRTTGIQSAPIPAFLVLFAKPVATASAALLGRGFRIAWGRIPTEKKIGLKKRWTKWILMSGAMMTGCAGYGYASHVQVCPYTGRRKFVALSKEQIQRISEAELEEIFEDNGKTILPIANPDYEKVAKIANRILESNKDIPEIFGKDWTISLVNQDIENAFVLPTGHIFVFKGMVDFCSNPDGHLNEDKLAIILGHEMAHAILGHTAEKLSLTNLIEACLMIPMAVLWAFIPSDGIAFITHWFIKKTVNIFIELPFSREMETEADTFGLKLTAKACFDVREAPVIWMDNDLIGEAGTILINCTKDEADILDDNKTLEVYLSTHPAHDARHKQLQEMMEAALAIRQECGCPKLDPELDPCQLANQRREWWNQNKDDMIKQEIEAKQRRRFQNRGIPLVIPQLKEEIEKKEENAYGNTNVEAPVNSISSMN